MARRRTTKRTRMSRPKLRSVMDSIRSSQIRGKAVRKANPNIFKAAESFRSSPGGKKVRDALNRFSGIK